VQNPRKTEILRVQGLFSHLTAAVLVAHTLLGCCWHHAHRCGQDEGAPGTLASADCTADHADDADHHAPRHSHHGPHDCLGGACVYIPAGQTRVVALAMDLSPAPGLALCFADQSALMPSVETSMFSAGDLCLPVRLHLAHQVLLI
jgi:hypothetical protein